MIIYARFTLANYQLLANVRRFSDRRISMFPSQIVLLGSMDCTLQKTLDLKPHNRDVGICVCCSSAAQISSTTYETQIHQV